MNPDAGSLTDAELELARTVAGAHAGLEFPRTKNYLVRARLHGLAHREGLPSIRALLGKIRGPAGPAWADKIGEALLTHETSFFRDPAVFDLLADVILPRLRGVRSAVRRLTILSAGCATGQEPFSVAMLIRNRFPDLCSWRLRILGGDVSEPMIDQARAGRFSALEAKRGLPAGFRDRFFRAAGDGWEVNGVIRGMVEFRRWNLAEPWPDLPPVDLLLIRNVLMYLQPAARDAALRHAARALAPDGCLIAGPADRLPAGICGLVPVRHKRTVFHVPGRDGRELRP